MTELDRARAFLEPALSYSGGTHTWDDIVQGIREGRFQLWPAPEGALLTEILTYPRKRVVNVFLAGGTLEQVMDMQPALAAWAKTQGATALTMAGRPGWAKVLPQHGWEPAYTAMRLEIGDDGR